MQENRPKFSFPLLSDGDILQCLQGLDIPCVAADLLKPKESHVRMILERFVELLTGEVIDKIQPDFNALSELSYPNLHEKSIAETYMQNLIVDLCHKAGVHDFRLTDIYNPEYKRTRRILSGIINFAKFREEKLAVYQEYTTQASHLLTCKHEAEKENEELSAQIQQLKLAKQDQIPIISQLRKEIENLMQKINDMNSEQAAIQQHIKLLKSQSSEYNVKVNDSKTKISFLNNQQEKLQNQIIHSPERIKENLHVLNNLVNRRKEDLFSKNSEAQTLQIRFDKLAKAMKKVEKRNNELEIVSSEIEKLQNCIEEIKNNEETIHKNEKNHLIGSEKLKELEENIYTLQQNLFELQKNNSQEAEHNSITLCQLQNINSTLLLESKKNKNYIQDQTENFNFLQKNLLDIKQQHHNEMNQLDHASAQLYEKIGFYHQQVLNNLL